ncbi:MAG: DUF1217 domain-containing protein [Pseudomonadota bacterium]
MTFSPIIPTGGLAGWSYLSRTLEQQETLYAASPQNARETSAFRERIATITTAEELVADRDLLKVALGAYGLGDDLNNRAFIEKVLAEGTQDPASFANRLADKRYTAFSEAFGFGDLGGPWTGLSGFADRVIESYQERDFEIAVGQVNETMRLALNMQRELPEIVNESSNPTTQWLLVLGNPPLRQAIETAFGLPSSFSGLDLDRQVEDLQDIAQQRFGVDTVSGLIETETFESLTRLYVTRAELAAPTITSSPQLSLFATGASAQSILLTLYQGA